MIAGLARPTWLRRIWLRRIWLTLAIVGCWSLVPAGSPARAEPRAQDGPETVRVGVDLLDIGRLDTSTGSYTLDFFLIFRCDRPCTPDTFEITNGRALSQTKVIDEPTEKVFRVQATLEAELHLRAFPFDRHTLTLELQDQGRGTDRLVYVADPAITGIGPSVVSPGWSVAPTWRATVADRPFPAIRRTMSHYSFGVDVYRPIFGSIFKGVLPALLMTLVGLLSLLIPIANSFQRITLGTSSLLGVVLYHLTMTSSIPPTGYLTFGDLFMIANYAALIIGLGTSVALMNLIAAQGEATDAAVKDRWLQRAQRLRLASLRSLPVFWLTAQGLLFSSLAAGFFFAPA